jgi:hypothetical protein
MVRIVLWALFDSQTTLLLIVNRLQREDFQQELEET